MPSLPLFVSPGDSLIARNSDLVIFAEGDPLHLRRMTTELAELVPSTDWTGLLRFLASKISTAGFDSHPPIACLQFLEESIGVFVFGDLTITIETTEATETVSGAGMTTWREVTVPGTVISASGGSTDFGSGVVGVLGRGLVAGGGFSVQADNPLKSSGSMLNAISGATTVAASTPPASVAPAITADEVDEVEEVEEVEEVAPELTDDMVAAPSDDDTTTTASIADDMSVTLGPVTPEQIAPTETFTVPMVDGMTSEEPPPPPPQSAVDHPAFDNHPADNHPAFDHPASSHPAAADTDTDTDDGFDPDLTTAFSGAAISEAVRAARSADPDPRRTSGVGEEAAVEPVGATELRGVHCPNGHLSSMQHPVCRTCSEPVDTDGPIMSGPRPILGVIEFDDGVRIPLDRPVVIGRQPPEDYRINGELAYVVPITDAEGLISRVHVEVHLVGWDIELIDKNSVNGTFTNTTTESTSRTRLRSEHPTPIDIGTIIYVGDRVFRLNTGHIVT